MGRSTKDVWAADAAGTLLLFEPEKLTLVTDPAHPLYDERVHLPADEALVRSIMRKGVLQPISCIRDNETGAVLVAAGRRRTIAAIEANRRLVDEGKPPKRIPVVPRPDTLAAAMEVSASENAIRMDETPLQRAHKMRAMLSAGHDMAGIAEAFGCGEATVQSTLSLLDLHPKAQAALADGALTATHAAKLLKLPPQRQAEAVERITAAAAGTAGHAKARKQREAVAEATGANTKPASRGKREIRAAMEAAPADSATRAVLAWVLGEAQELPG